MIEEAITKIQELADNANRATQLEIVDVAEQKKYHYIYDDSAEKYELVHTENLPAKQTGDVSNIESFVALVREETLRRAPVAVAPATPKNGTDKKPADQPRHDGSFMTVVFGADVAKFSPDDRVRIDSFTYARALSPQWDRMTKSLNTAMDHKTFIRALQALRPSIVNYEELMRHFRKLHFSDRTSIASEPLLEAGRNTNDYKVEIELRSGGADGNTTAPTTIPGSFEVELQYARGSEQRYKTTIEIDLSTVMIQNSDRRALRFTQIAPDLANVVEQAIDDEVAYFRSQVTDIPRLLILQDY